jgi:hypothetical protein
MGVARDEDLAARSCARENRRLARQGAAIRRKEAAFRTPGLHRQLFRCLADLLRLEAIVDAFQRQNVGCENLAADEFRDIACRGFAGMVARSPIGRRFPGLHLGK